MSVGRDIPLHMMLAELEERGLLVDPPAAASSIEISKLADDSRDVSPGSLFVAIAGTSHDGHLYIGQALEAGASAVVCEGIPTAVSGDAPIFVVTDSRKALGALAHLYWGRPTEAIRAVGVTGTNGKTTTTWLIDHMLTSLGRKSGLIGTIENRFGDSAEPAALTTPGSIELNALLSRMREDGCTDVAMEVSSHALAQHRTEGLRFAAAVFTNLTRDHLDYHASWTDYFNAKRSLFESLDSDAYAVINADDELGQEVSRSTKATSLTFGTVSKADHRFHVVSNTVDGLGIDIDGDTRQFQLVGGFNAYNLTAAYTVGVALGYRAPDVLEALESARPVPGRLEQFKFQSGVTVVVDYAHTPDALKNALEAVKDTAPAHSTIWCIFGCGGDRDPGKRPEMGSIAEAVADRVIVTSDNPRTEAPEAILDDIRDGMERPERAEWIVDRSEAIQFVGRSAASGDIVLVAGKGHEPYQAIGGSRVHFDDREEVKKWFG